MQSNDLHRVLGARLQTVDDGRLGVPSWGWDQLPFALLGTGVQDPVGCDDSLGTVPADPQGGGLDVGEAKVFGVVHVWRWRSSGSVRRTGFGKVFQCEKDPDSYLLKRSPPLVSSLHPDPERTHSECTQQLASVLRT